MKVLQETFTVLPDPALHEVSVLLAGMRISFTVDETRRLASDLSKALQALNAAEARKSNGLGEIVSESEARDLGAELRAAKDEMKRVPSLPRVG
ncbi:MAG TPA: hypothetical protein VFA50_09290 [Stellaceae bacterium]|nr:hypothetical protein [Stellaceae bacterium]